MKQKKKKKKPTQAQQWQIVLETTEAALNLYSVLVAFSAEGQRVLNDEALLCIKMWLRLIERAVPTIQTLAEDVRGPFRERDRAQINLVIQLNDKERQLMLFICKTIYHQLLQPEERTRWIQNQGQADYDIAIAHYRSWAATLEQ